MRPTPWWDWVNVIDLDYDNPELREYMTTAMKYWVSEVDIDGYRCDVAGILPMDFWNTLRAELDTIKPVFLLAKWEKAYPADAVRMTFVSNHDKNGWEGTDFE